MRIVSVNAGQPRQGEWKGKVVTTAIFKDPVPGRVWARRHNIDGDAQADLSVHGGPAKAVYAYSSEHYEFWAAELGAELPWGMFGENLTTQGLAEDDMRIGDELGVGGARFRVTEPRMPCSKLALRFERPDMVKRFLKSGRTGFYLAVLDEGELGAGDEVTFSRPHEYDLTIADITRLYARDRDDIASLRRAADHPLLDIGWRTHFQKRVDLLGGARGAV